MTTKMTTKETAAKLKDEEYYSKFITERLKEAKDDLKEHEAFIKNTLAEFEVILMLADDMAKELHKHDEKSVTKARYETIKSSFNIK
jgi:hypothetical protein